MAEGTMKQVQEPPHAAPPAEKRPEGAWAGLTELRDEMSRAFEGFWRNLGYTLPTRRLGMELPSLAFPLTLGTAVPDIDLVETGKSYQLSVDVPGIDPADLELTIAGDMLKLHGERRAEARQDGDNQHVCERYVGTFHRSIRLPPGVLRDRVEAKFDKGVLRVTLPKSAEAETTPRRIPVRGAA